MNNNIKKKQLLHNLKHDVYCRVGVSKIHGVGVIAIKDIPKGTNPYMIPGNKCIQYNAIDITKEEVNSLNPVVQKLIHDFIAQNDDGSFSVPYNGFNALDVSFYQNMSKQPNMDIVDVDDCDFVQFIANRDIKTGEELTINYQEF